MANQLPPPEKLDLEGDSSSVGLRWTKWKRSLQIYLEAANIIIPEKKRATLLVLGGEALQEIYFNFPGASVDPGDDVDVFEVAMSKLDDYFVPKQNKIYERHIFRLIKQDEGESFEKFLLKLRDQATKCRFEKPDEHIVDQIIGKCLSSELRKKLLTMGDEITLDKVITAANTLEIVNYQLESYEQKGYTKPNEVNVIKSMNNRNSRPSKQGNETNEETPLCTRCGLSTHLSDSTMCPAKQKRCNACGKLGHYQRCCKTKIFQQKRRMEQNEGRNKNKKKLKDSSLQDEEVHYVF